MSYVRPHMRNGRPVRGHQRRTPGNRVRVRSTVDSNGVPRRAHYRAKPHTTPPRRQPGVPVLLGRSRWPAWVC